MDAYFLRNLPWDINMRDIRRIGKNFRMLVCDVITGVGRFWGNGWSCWCFPSKRVGGRIILCHILWAMTMKCHSLCEPVIPVPSTLSRVLCSLLYGIGCVGEQTSCLEIGPCTYVE